MEPQIGHMNEESGGAKQPRGRILVVDDDPIMREVVCEQLTALDYEFVQAENGEIAAGFVGQDSFKLAIIDISMPKMDGFELLRHIRQNPRCIDLPVVVCTSHNDRTSIDRAYDLGASSFVTKPINWALFAHHAQFVIRNGESERALRAAQAEAVLASRVKNGMFHVLSHELKTPLTALIGLTDVLHDSLKERVTDEESEQLRHVVDGARRLNGIISDILILSKALARPERNKYSSILVSEILDDALTGHKAHARARDVKLLQRPLEREFEIDCDPHLVRQALSKLVDNAVRFSPQGSTVEVWAHGKPDGSTIISVRDQGPGLTQAKLKECLKPFVQDDMSYGRPAEGLGLGLPIAKAICEAHGGELIVQTAPGRGFLAAVWLPARRRPVASVEGSARCA